MAAMAISASIRPARRRLLRGLVLPTILLVLWELSSKTGLIDARFLPPLETIARTAWAETLDGGLLVHLGASLTRNLAGFFVGTAIGIAFGALLGLSRLTNLLFGPTFHAAKQVAVLAWIPIISIWFGFAETAKIVFIAIAAFGSSRSPVRFASIAANSSYGYSCPRPRRRSLPAFTWRSSIPGSRLWRLSIS